MKASVPTGDPSSTKRGTACDSISETTVHGDLDQIGADSKVYNQTVHCIEVTHVPVATDLNVPVASKIKRGE